MPSYAEELTQPLQPSNVQVNVSQTRIHVTWDSELEGDAEVAPEWEDFLGEDFAEFDETETAQDISAYAPNQGDYIDRGLTSFWLIDGNDSGVETDEEIAFFQVQVATDPDFTVIVRHDRHVKGHAKTWRYHRPSSSTYYARVRSVDALGNKSDWVFDSNYSKFPYQPWAPNVRMKKQDNGMFRAAVSYINDPYLSPDLDENLSRFQFAARELEFTKLDGDISASDSPIHVFDAYTDINDEVPMDPDVDYPSFVVYVGNEQMLVTSISGAQGKNWHVTRGYNGTTAKTHNDGQKVYFFGKSNSAVHQMVTIDDTNASTSAQFRGLDPGSRWKMKVRVIDNQNRRSFWSGWTPVLKAAVGVSYINDPPAGGTGNTGDPDTYPDPSDPGDPPGTTTEDGEDTSTVAVIDWPHERIIRFESDVSDGWVGTEAASGFDAVATAARVTVTGAPTSSATVDINLNGVSFLTVTIPQDETQSDLTWVTPPLRIGSSTGQALVSTDAISVTQTSMSGASGTLTVYLMVYLT